jgi:hypothetical protein
MRRFKASTSMIGLTLQEFRWLYSRIATWEQPQLANCIVHEMLPRLLAADREDEALRLVKERLEIDLRFRPRTSDLNAQ